MSLIPHTNNIFTAAADAPSVHSGGKYLLGMSRTQIRFQLQSNQSRRLADTGSIGSVGKELTYHWMQPWSLLYFTAAARSCAVKLGRRDQVSSIIVSL